MNKIKSFLTNQDTKVKATKTIEEAGKVVIIGLAAIGALVVIVIVTSVIEEKKDPEKFHKEWLEEMKEQLESEQG